MPTFHVRGRNFTIFIVNHHGSGHVEPWLNAPDGAHDFHCDAEPEHHFWPPYIGPSGWIRLDVEETVNWDELKALVLGSYERFARKRMPPTIIRQVTP